MRTLAAVLAMAVILAVPLGLMGPASAASPGRDLTPVIIGPVVTDRLGGGDLVAVKAGDAVFGVVYGTSDHRNDIVIFAEYKRFLGGANIYDARGDYLATRGIPVDTRDKTARVPWYKVMVDDGNRYDITHVQFEGYKNVTGPAVAMGAKYDHNITGWDFAYPGDELALETHLLFGNFIPERTADFIHEAFQADHADDGNRTTLGDPATLNETAPTHPRLYTRDSVYLDDAFTRIGRFTWVTDVTVDGVNKPNAMSFNIQGGGRLTLSHNGAYFLGFWLRAAFVYPAGQTIVHDPAISTESLVDLPSGVNLTPLTILAAQLAVVAIALGPALYLRAKARRPK